MFLSSSVLWMIATACSGPAGEGSSAAPSDSSDSTSEPLEIQPWTAEEIGESLDDLLRAGLPSGQRLFRLTTDLLASGDETCPGSATSLDWPPSGCAAETGYVYAGVLQMETTLSSGEALEVEERTARLADLRIDRPDGLAFLSAGYFYGAKTASGTVTTYTSMVQGTWQDLGSEQAWLQAGTSADLDISLKEEDSRRKMRVDGALGSAAGAVVIEEPLVLEPQVCAEAPVEGRLLVRTPEARWLSVEWAGDCDPCREILLESGEVLGVACLSVGESLRAAALDMEAAW